MSTHQQYARPGDTGHQCNILALQLLRIVICCDREIQNTMIGLYLYSKVSIYIYKAMLVVLGNKQICLIVSVGSFGVFTFFLTHVLPTI